jgi:hypothetical protein
VVRDEKSERIGFGSEFGERLLAVGGDLDFVAIGFQGERKSR